MKYLTLVASLIMLAAMTCSCEDSKSYAELLTDENHLVNAFLAEHRVVEYFPADSYEVGENAPFYRLDEEGDVYMQVLRKGDGIFPATDDRVYFRYTRYDLNYYVVGSDNNYGAGNAISVGAADPVFFLLDNYTVSQSTQYGTGIQLPVKLLGYNSKVNVVIKSQSGPTSDMSYVIPYLYTISYYAPAGVDLQ